MSEKQLPPMRGRPVIFGEVLFDTFPDGREVLGGAPFNVARHLHAFGCEPLFISRVGADGRGERVREAMAEWGMDSRGLQQDGDHPTGIVRIAMQGTAHTFDILPEQAYDHIDGEQALAALHGNEPGLLYFGSLAERAPTSRRTLEQLRGLGLPQFVDINLRAPWWQQERVASLLQGVEWLKLNDEELVALGYEGEVAAAATAMRDAYGFDRLTVTCGDKGALFVDSSGVERGEPVAVEQLVDTVGAGDAFSAVTILGLLRGWDPHKTLRHALGFAAHLCEVRGAVLPERGYYQRVLSEWQ
ncbi:MAG: carbohydrate kinase family protein [Pseudomonadota bacterium]